MKAAILINIIFFSISSFADSCNHLRPEPVNFDTSYIRSNIYAPNWDDECHELGSVPEMNKCVTEASAWEQWYVCDKKLLVERTLTCTSENIGFNSGSIQQVVLDLLDNGMRIKFNYDGQYADTIHEEEFTNGGKGQGKVTFSKEKLIFGYDGEFSGLLASFNNGKTYEGQAVIAQDFKVFLECK